MSELYKIKPLEWQRDEDGDWAAGGYYIRQLGSAKWGWAELPYSVADYADSLDEAKAAVEADRLRHLLQRLEPVPALMTALRELPDPDDPALKYDEFVGEAYAAWHKKHANALAQVEKADG